VVVELFLFEPLVISAYIWLNYGNWLGSQPGSVPPPHTYHCSDLFLGDLAGNLSNGLNAGTVVRLEQFNDPELTIGQPSRFPGGANPVFAAFAAYVNDVGIRLTENGTDLTCGRVLASKDTANFIVSKLLGIAYIVRCNVTLYDAVYNWVNGAFHNFTTLTLSNATLSATVNGPLQLNATFGNNNLMSNALLATMSNSTQEALDSIAYVYSQTTLGLASGIFRPRVNLQEFTRQQLIVAKIPFAPFYSLIVLDLLCALIGAVLAIVAVVKRDYSGGSLLTLWGLVAQAFESLPPHGDIRDVKNMFQEARDGTSKVVGIEKVGESGSWRFKTYSPDT